MRNYDHRETSAIHRRYFRKYPDKESTPRNEPEALSVGIARRKIEAYKEAKRLGVDVSEIIGE